MEGTLEYFSGLLSSHKKKKRKQLQTVELKVRMDCEGCELKVKKALSSMKGVCDSPLLSSLLSSAFFWVVGAFLCFVINNFKLML